MGSSEKETIEAALVENHAREQALISVLRMLARHPGLTLLSGTDTRQFELTKCAAMWQYQDRCIATLSGAMLKRRIKLLPVRVWYCM